MKRTLVSLSSFIASLALFVGISSVNSPSVYIFHQPKVPTGLEKFRR